MFLRNIFLRKNNQPLSLSFLTIKLMPQIYLLLCWYVIKLQTTKQTNKNRNIRSGNPKDSRVLRYNYNKQQQLVSKILHNYSAQKIINQDFNFVKKKIAPKFVRSFSRLFGLTANLKRFLFTFERASHSTHLTSMWAVTNYLRTDDY